MSNSTQELISNMMNTENLWQTEGHQGRKNLLKVMEKIGYDTFEDFLDDNSGAIEALLTWMGDSDVDDWNEKLKEYADAKEVIISVRATETGDWFYWECEQACGEDFPTREEAVADAEEQGHTIVEE